MLDPKDEKIEVEVTKPTKEEISETKDEIETPEPAVVKEKKPKKPKVVKKETKLEDTAKAEVTTKVEEANKEENTTKAVEEVEEVVAEDAEDENKDEIPKEVTATNYDELTLDQLTDELEKLLATQKVHQIKTTAEAINSAFNIKFGKQITEKKAAFLAEGGNSIDFQFSSPVKARYNQLLSNYKKERDAYYANLEKQLKENLEKREQVIEDLKSLIENADPKTMYKSFRDIQNSWRAIGPVPKTKYNDTWKIYHHHVERFYDLLHLSNDFRDLDFKNKLEEKLKLIEKD